MTRNLALIRKEQVGGLNRTGGAGTYAPEAPLVNSAGLLSRPWVQRPSCQDRSSASSRAMASSSPRQAHPQLHDLVAVSSSLAAIRAAFTVAHLRDPIQSDLPGRDHSRASRAVLHL